MKRENSEPINPQLETTLRNRTASDIEASPDVTYLARSFRQFERALERRLRTHFSQGTTAGPPEDGMDVPWLPDDSAFGRFVRECARDEEARLLVLLALAPSMKPDFFDRILQGVSPGAGEHPEFGGLRGRQHRGFIPTGDTALFLLGGDDLDARARWQTLLCGDHPLVQKGIVSLDEAPEGDPPMSGRLTLDSDYAERFISGKVRAPRLSMRFPARRLDTSLDWDDVVLPPRTLAEIRGLENWIRQGEVLMNQWNMRHKLRPGCRALFFGPPGTGKTLTATVLGKVTGRQVYKVDLSSVVSKYIGETEKNLAQVFAAADPGGAVLLFDEADALFGKRSEVKDSHDRYANLEISYLLQRMENYRGLAILTTNNEEALDPAFTRRLRTIVQFPFPDAAMRERIWQRIFPTRTPIEALRPDRLARPQFSGGTIRNVALTAAFLAAEEQQPVGMAHLKQAAEIEATKMKRPLGTAETHDWLLP
jgi:AAA+ superfamily predicted ATPase